MYLFFNQKFYETGVPVIPADSKAFRYGELVFETIRYANGNIHFFDDHFERLQKASSLLQISFPKLFSKKQLENSVQQLLQKNKLQDARIRITVFKGCGGLFEQDESAFNLLIETYPIPADGYQWNSNGLDLCFFDKMQKGMDSFSNYKTGNFLIYNLAAAFSKKQKSNEALIFNTAGRICDSTISNIFMIKNGIISTPPLEEGAIQGIFRQFLLKKIPGIVECFLGKEMITSADEVFLTNAIRGIQWVKQIETKHYTNKITQSIFKEFVTPLNRNLPK